MSSPRAITDIKNTVHGNVPENMVRGSVRIGIDVGGTFTHAVALDNTTYSLIGQSKVPTTHKAKNGVAQGIIDSLNNLLKNCSIKPSDVIFIAHSTTQATNALLEGDVAPVGIIAVGRGLEGRRVRSETDIGNISLEGEKQLKILHRYTDVQDLNESKIKDVLDQLIADGSRAIVAAEAFSVDDPRNEKLIVDLALSKGIPAVGTHEISGLYGLRMRTRTAVINASIMPKMLEAANATALCVKQAGINSPLMIMRSDGGVMSIDEMKKRPILTILSGPAAGVASALLYVKISNGIFLEVGGTSTDIAVIKNGRAQVKSAEIGGHKVFLRTLDSRTVGVAGGSMPRLSGNEIIDVGPRSAHIAGLIYSAFSSDADISGCEITGMQPGNEIILNDPKGYFSIGGKYAITTTCAANARGLVKESDWAYGNGESAKCAISILAKKINRNPEEVSAAILELASAKAIKIIKKLISDYKLEKERIVLIGGGGGAAAIVPFTAKHLNMDYKIAENHAVISAIGAALAMVMDTIERSVINPAREDIIKIHRDVEESVIRMGAAAETIEVAVQVDQQKNVLRATATGTTELRKKDLLLKVIPENERRRIAAASMKAPESNVKLLGSTDFIEAWGSALKRKSFFGLIRQIKNPIRIIDKEGIVRLSKGNGIVCGVDSASSIGIFGSLLAKYATYGDAGEKIPEAYLLYRSKVVDLSGMLNSEQVMSIFKLEIEKLDEKEKVVIILALP